MKNNYNFGYDNIFIEETLKQRSLETHAQFLQPYLNPGMSVLDCGCGPGTITLGIATKINPGKVIGVDLDSDQIALAKVLAEKKQVTNIDFMEADLYKLPFADNSFDLVFAHAVFLHLSRPELALQELKRVIVPNGIIALRCADSSSTIIYPNNPVLQAAFDLYNRPIVDSGGDIDLGRKLRALLHNAKFRDIYASGFCQYSGDTALTDALGKFLANHLGESQYIQQLVDSGQLTSQQLEQYQQAWLDFSADPSAFFSYTWCEAIGYKP